MSPSKAIPSQSEGLEYVLARFENRVDDLRSQWRADKPFPYFVADDFLPMELAETILNAYPTPGVDAWDRTTYTHQRKKFTRTKNLPAPIDELFAWTATERFRELLSEVTGIPGLLADPELLGGGLHQIARGGFLDVHVDFNFHPKTKLHRRLNLLLYMNRDWKPDYQGHLELWDMDEHQLIESVSPDFNRMVLFETSEVSYHGHPHPLQTPAGVTRKSLAVYYYTEERVESAVAAEHNTLYRQTTGVAGYVKTLHSSLEATVERAHNRGVAAVVRQVARKLKRTVKGELPENKVEDVEAGASGTDP